MDIEDDDSENDSDYVPTTVQHNGASSESEDELAHELSVADVVRKRKVDAIFEDMVKEDKQYGASKFSKSVCRSNAVGTAKRIKQSQAVLLESIFGRKVAKSLVKGSSVLGKETAPPVEDPERAAALKERALKSAKSILKKTKVVEKKKFAGEEILVEKTVLLSSAASSGRAAKSTSCLDQALDLIKGPKAISTVVKSSTDWDNFKEKEGLNDDLAAASKDGYLTRKEFLERVDLRTFEKEKEERAANRAKKG